MHYILKKHEFKVKEVNNSDQTSIFIDDKRHIYFKSDLE